MQTAALPSLTGLLKAIRWALKDRPATCECAQPAGLRASAPALRVGSLHSLHAGQALLQLGILVLELRDALMLVMGMPCLGVEVLRNSELSCKHSAGCHWPVPADLLQSICAMHEGAGA